jgi:hypothetical protein
VLSRQVLAFAGHRFHYRFDDILDDMKLAPHIPHPVNCESSTFFSDRFLAARRP